MEPKFYVCEHCGNIVVKIIDSGVPVVCCGAPMRELVPGTSDGAYEKHVPAVKQEGNTVSAAVGSVAHPMTEPHFIQFIWLQTDKGNQVRSLTPADKPEACFTLCDGEKVLAVYAYCNLHGLWKA